MVKFDFPYSNLLPESFGYLQGILQISAMEVLSRMAAEAASLHVYSKECDNEEIPIPSVNLSKEDTEGNVIMPSFCFFRFPIFNFSDLGLKFFPLISKPFSCDFFAQQHS